MACEIFGINQSWWSFIGIAADFVGVAFLGFDLVRLQRHLRMRAHNNLDLFEEMAEEYGGIESWSEEIQKQAKWMPQSSYSRYSLDDEVLFNAQRIIERVYELGTCVNGLAQHLSKLLSLESQRATQDVETSHVSLRFSIFGLIAIAIGFALQGVGAWPC